MFEVVVKIVVEIAVGKEVELAAEVIDRNEGDDWI